MSDILCIKKFEAEDKLIEASKAYEDLLSNKNINKEQCVNLMVLYLTCLDPGYAANKRLSSSFLDFAYDRIYQLNQFAKSNFLCNAAPDFWLGYSKFVVLGDLPDEALLEKFIETDQSYDPLIYFPTKSRSEYREKLLIL
jgi:hypothetical protein